MTWLVRGQGFMESDGTYETSDTRGAGLPRPSAPPPPDRVPPAPALPPAAPAAAPPPVPAYAPGAGGGVAGTGGPGAAGVAGLGGGAGGAGGEAKAVPAPPGSPPAAAPPRSAVAEWMDAPRPAVGPGVWRFRYVAAESDGRDRMPPATFAGMLIPLVLALLIWSAWNSGIVPYRYTILRLLTPNDWWWGPTTSPTDWHGYAAHEVFKGFVCVILVYVVGFLGSWGKIARHYLGGFQPPVRAALAGLAALAALTLVWPDAFGLGWKPLPLVAPVLSLTALLAGGYEIFSSPFLVYTVYTLVTALVVWPFARVGDWKGLWLARRARQNPPAPVPTGPKAPPSQWPELREAGEYPAADRLVAEVAGGRMNDVDVARVRRAWAGTARDGVGRAALVGALLREGAGAAAHPSGDRDLPARTAEHDLFLGQVRIGRYAPAERAPAPYVGAGAALGPALLGTSLLAVGPSGSGKTRALVAPVVESLTLQALTGGCAVVAVGEAGAPLGPDAAYDVVIRLGDPASPHDLDLYAGATDPDEAAVLLAEGLVGDLEGLETRRAATVLAQLIGPYRAAYGRFPTVPVLRELLEAGPGTLQTLLDLLPQDRSAMAMRRELESRLRQAGTAGDPGPVLADRLATLDRPVFAEFFGGGGGTGTATGHGKGAGDERGFSLRAVARHPIRVRISLPEGAHEEASRLLNRLILAQFQSVVRDRDRQGQGAGHGHFACLVLDDAAGALTQGTVRALQRLRPQNAGVVLALRTLAEVPEALRGPLLAVVGCRMAFAGIPTWDGRAFADTWGTERFEKTEVAHHTVFADQPMTRFVHFLRKKVTGKAVTTEAVTVREVERERWSASDLAHTVPPGHAVLSLTDVRGEHTPPLLVDLRRGGGA
ncbi:ATP/GTP-binding protein [Streptomyces sp. NPDC048717]|uniref:ATP/GTP-binding protein n=1 Tax=Streptomyces sp. NPDC048717 TaxID=3154928 RepID=UPI0034284370